MKLSELHSDLDVSAVSLFKGEGSVNAIQLQKNAILKKHITKIPALLVCVSGHVVYEDEQHAKHHLMSGDCVEIVPEVVHWLEAKELSHLILMK